MSGCAIIGAIVGVIAGGFLGVVTAMFLVASCIFGDFSDSFCAIQYSVDLGTFVILAALLGAGIGALCVLGGITLVKKQRVSQRYKDGGWL